MLTWTTQDGHKVELTIGSEDGDVTTLVRVDGKHFASGLPSLLSKPQGEAVARIGGLGLTRERYHEILAALEAAEFETMDIDDLIEERCQLVINVNAWEGSRHDAATGRIERASQTGIDTGSPKADSRLDAAIKALADFDTAHPEVIAEIKRERAERIARAD